MMESKKNTNHKIVSGIFITYFIFWFYEGHFLFQLNNPVLKTTGIDNTYWLFCILRIPQIIIQHAIFFDVLLITSFVFSLIIKNKWTFRILLTIVIINVVTFNVYSGIHSKSCVILPMILLPYCFPKIKKLLNDGIRYYLLFIFVSAAIYKIANGGLFHTNQFVHILENQHLDLAVLNPTHFTYKISVWLIKHPIFANTLWYLFFVSELVFTIGFFTKKYDLFLAFFLIIIIITTYILMRISLFDFILFLPFLGNILSIDNYLSTSKT